MRPFLSLSWKLLGVLLAVMLSASVTMTWLWLQRSAQEFASQQQSIRDQSARQYQLVNQMMRGRLEAWLEGLIHFQPNVKVDTLTQMLQSEWEFLQINWQVNDIWLLSEGLQLRYSSTYSLPDYVLNGSQQALQQQASGTTVFCASQCQQLLFMPVLTDDDAVHVLVASFTLLDSLAFLHQSTQAQLAIVNIDPLKFDRREGGIRFLQPLGSQLEQSLSALLAALERDTSAQQLLSQGAKVSLNEQVRLLTLLDMQSAESPHHYLMLVHDITDEAAELHDYQRKIIGVAVSVFSLLLILLLVVTGRFRQRLMFIASRLPLLANRRFDVFQERTVSGGRWFRDELDTLQQAAAKLADQLSSLDEQVNQRTQELERIAMYDELTQLPNRNMLTYQLNDAIASLSRLPGYVILLFLDLDDFKKVNDSYGHDAGDQLLIEASARLSSVLRSTDMACRLGGDEFVILLRHVAHLEAGVLVARKVLERFKAPVRIGDAQFYVSCSIGLAITDQTQCSSAELIRYADTAMYAAKRAGGNCYRLFDSAMSQQALTKVALESEAREALLNNQFFFALQPQVSMQDDALTGFEALLRWRHPDKGLIAPGTFIPVLEHTAFFVHVGYWVMEHAVGLLAMLREWGYGHLTIAINLSASQFLDKAMIPRLRDLINDSGIDPSRLEVELTESSLLHETEQALVIADELKLMGIKLAIDDFGTGYSSLSYLRNIPAEVIKIDRGFVQGMLENEADRHIVAATIELINNLGLTVVAEGIETASQYDTLRRLNCDVGQGFWIAKPIAETELLSALRQHCEKGYWKLPSDHIQRPLIGNQPKM
ncbi:EAL domain-containing protein [Aestuariibacter halophilus]|uniref:EAL domain-containing protein n=1 Tax=Fluctibacter halophilus TaxID=226011 RepID=A0ABS8GCH2_9ALTE|nr:EAL domain-containing protein [Aestuariibacter halophilus]MCC2617520.1 EAL domain-containing protein [Aestuariibacter halophilus]